MFTCKLIYSKKEVVAITFEIALTIIQYGIFFMILSGSAYYMYQRLTTKDEREFYRLKIQKEIAERKDKLVEKELNSNFQKKIEQAQLKRFNAFRFQFVRLLFIIYFAFNYLVIPYIDGEGIGRLLLLSFVTIIILSEPRFKFSLINVFLNSIIHRKQKAKIIELFTLFDILKAELNTLKDEQEVNVYSIIQNVLPMFNHIQGTLSKFLSLWKRSPKVAKEIFHDEIGGDSAKAIGDILYKLDSVSRKDALEVIESESSVFSVQYYQKELQKATKSSTAFFGFFLTTNVIVIIWLIVFVFVMIQERMNGTNTGLY